MFLASELVTVEWEVVPTVIEDKYEIVLNTTFETDVPAAVVVADPKMFNLPVMEPGDVYNGEFTLTNHGLIRAYDIRAAIPQTNQYFKYEILGAIPETIEAKETITMPLRVTCLNSITQEEEGGAGAGEGCTAETECLTWWYLFECANGETKEETEEVCVSTQKGDCSKPGEIIPSNAGRPGVGGTDSTGVVWISSDGETISPQISDDGEVCRPPEKPEPKEKNIDGAQCRAVAKCLVTGVSEEALECCQETARRQPVESVVNIVRGTYEDSLVDLSIPVPGGKIELKRRYFDDKWQWEKNRRKLIINKGNVCDYKYESIPETGRVYKVRYCEEYIMNLIEDVNDVSWRVHENIDPKKVIIDKYFIQNPDYTQQFLDPVDKTIRSFRPGYNFSFMDRFTQGLRVYDPDGRLITFRKGKGATQQYIYDDQDRITGIKDVNDRQVLWYEYVPECNGTHVMLPSGALIPCPVAAAWDIHGRRVEYEYDVNYNLKKVTKIYDMGTPEEISLVTQYFYDGQNRLTKKIEPSGRETNLAYYEDNFIKSVIYEDGTGTYYNYAYDEGKEEYYSSVQFTSGKITERWFGQFGDKIREDINGKTIMQMLTSGRDKIFIDAAGNRTTKKYDELGRLTSIFYPNNTSVSYEYKPNTAKVSKKINELGVITEYEYDDNGNMTKQTEAVGTPAERTTEYTYDVDGNLIETRLLGGGDPGDSPEVATVYTYDTNGNITSITDPEGTITTFTYNEFGNMLTKCTNSTTWYYQYDALGNQTVITDPLGNSTTNWYDVSGNVIRVDTPSADGVATEYEYDFNNNLTVVRRFIGTEPLETTYEYNTDNKLTKQTDPSTSSGQAPEGNTTTYQYDLDGRLTKVIDGGGNAIQYIYDDTGQGGCTSCAGTNNPAKIIYPNGMTKEFQYDLMGRKIKETNNPGSGYEGPLSGIGGGIFEYDSTGNLTKQTDAEGNITQYEYDSLNRLTKVIDSNNGETIYGYDSRGNLLTLTDANNNTTTFEYDKNNRVTKEIRPMLQETTYEYDSVGNLILKTDAKGQTTEYDYNAIGQLVAVRFIGQDQVLQKEVAYTYDPTGNLTGYDDGTSSGTYKYDELGRKIAEHVNIDGIPNQMPLMQSFSYSGIEMQKNETTIAGDQYNYDYDANGNPSTITIPNLGSITFNYENPSTSLGTGNQPTSIIYPGGTKHTYKYDPFMRTSTITVTDPGQNQIMQYAYTYDNMNNIIEQSRIGGAAGGSDAGLEVASYAYDDLYQLTEVTYPSNPRGMIEEQFGYDPVGNRISHIKGTASEIIPTYNFNNELETYGPISYNYDSNGNTIEKIDGSLTIEYIYDIENRLVAVRLIGQDSQVISETSYYYDPFGRRLYKEVAGVRTYYIYNDRGLAAELDADGNITREYSYAPGSIWGTNPIWIKEGGEYFWYHNDHLGTPQKLTSETGALAWSATYDAFGEATVDPTSTLTNNLRMPGQYEDIESGLFYNYHRYYDYNIGRYTQEDPIRFWGLDINLYRYVTNNPINYFDQSGYLGGSGGIIIPPPIPLPPIPLPTNIPKSRYGDCTEEQHNKLQDAVNKWCKHSGSTSCDDPCEDCSSILAKMLINLLCARARDTINNVCYRGGDKGHKTAAQNAWRAYLKCSELAIKKGCN